LTVNDYSYAMAVHLNVCQGYGYSSAIFMCISGGFKESTALMCSGETRSILWQAVISRKYLSQ